MSENGDAEAADAPSDACTWLIIVHQKGVDISGGGSMPGEPLKWALNALESSGSKVERSVHSYSHDDLAKGLSSADAIEKYVSELLETIRKLGELNTSPKTARPIVFVGHRLGGTIIKRLLALAARERAKYRYICDATRATVFVDALHRTSRHWEAVNSVARWLSGSFERSDAGFLLPSVQALAPVVCGAHEDFIETKFAQLVEVVSFDFPLEPFPAESAKTEWPVATINGRILDLSESQSEVEEKTQAQAKSGDDTRGATWAKLFHEYVLTTHLLSPPIKDVISGQSAAQASASTESILQSESYLSWRGVVGPDLLQLYGSKTREVTARIIEDVSAADGKKPTILQFAFKSYDQRYNNFRSAAIYFIAQICLRASQSDSYTGNESVFKQPKNFGAWSDYDVVYTLNWLCYTRNILIILRDFDECEYDSREGFLRESERTMWQTEQTFKLLITTRGPPRDNKWKSINTDAQQTALTVRSKEDAENGSATPDNANGGVSSVHADQSTESGGQRRSGSSTVEGHQRGVPERLDVWAKMATPQFRQLPKLKDGILGIKDVSLQDAVLEELLQSSSPLRLAERLCSLGETDSIESYVRQLLASTPESDKEVLHQVLIWIALAVRPLSIQELGAVVQRHKNEQFAKSPSYSKATGLRGIQPIVELIEGIVVMKGNDVAFMHPKIRDVLVRVKDSEWFGVTEQDHIHITRLCLDLLHQEDATGFDKNFKGVVYTFETEDVLFPPSMFEDRTSLLWYAVAYWPAHYRLIPQTQRPVREVLVFFDESNEDTWCAWNEARWIIQHPGSRPDRSWRTPLPILAGLGHVELLRSWLNRSKQQFTGTAAIDGGLALVEAARAGALDVVELLLASLDGNLRDLDLQDALLVAAAKTHAPIAQRLIEAAHDGFAWPPLLLLRLSALGFEECVNALLSRGCDPNVAAGFMGLTPLHTAVRNGRIRISELLLEYGADTAALTNLKASVCTYAGNFPLSGEVIRLMARRGIDVCVVDDNNDTGLYEANRLGHPKVVAAYVELARAGDLNHEALQRLDVPMNIDKAADYNFVKCVRADLELLEFAEKDIKKRKDILVATMKNAAKSGNLELVRAIMEKVPKDEAASAATLVLCHICPDASPSLDIIKLLVEEHGADVNSTGDNDNVPIFGVAEYGHLDHVRYFLEHGAEINGGNRYGLTAIMIAARYGHSKVISCLLESGANIDWRDNYGESALFEAASYSRIEAAELLLERGATASGKGWQGRTILHCVLEYPNLMRKVLERHPETDMLNDDGLAPIHMAGKDGRTEAIEVLAKFKANLDLPSGDKYDNHSALMFAAKNSHVETAEALLNAGANVDYAAESQKRGPVHYTFSEKMLALIMQYSPKLDARDKWGSTTLYYHCTAPKPNLAVIKKLYYAKANINALSKGDKGDPGLSHLVSEDRVEIVEFLLSKGADTNLHSRNKGSPLHVACKKGNLAMVKRLVAAGATADLAVDNFAGNPLQSVCLGSTVDHDTVEIIKYLVDEAHADVDQQCGNYWTAVAASCLRSSADALKQLLEHGADPHIADPLGRMPVHFAATTHIDILQHLLSVGCSLKPVDKTGRTVLQWAAQSGSVDLVKLVLSRVDVEEEINKADKDGWTPLCWAARGRIRMPSFLPARPENTDEGQADLIELLIDRGASKSVLVKGDAPEGEETPLWSPLQIAVWHAQTGRVTELLVEKLVNGRKKLKRHNSSAGQLRRGYSRGGFCDCCQSPLYGSCWNCKDCEDFDFCFKCYNQVKEIHDIQHVFKNRETVYDETYEPEPVEDGDEEDSGGESDSSSVLSLR